MDKIVWDLDVLQDLTALLRGYSSALDEDAHRLHALRAEQSAVLRGERGKLTKSLQDRTDRCVKLLDEASERTGELAAAMEAAMEAMVQTESRLRREAETLPVSAEAPDSGRAQGLFL